MAMIRMLLLLFAIFLAACGSKAPAVKRYPMDGTVKALDDFNAEFN